MTWKCLKQEGQICFSFETSLNFSNPQNRRTFETGPRHRDLCGALLTLEIVLAIAGAMRQIDHLVAKLGEDLHELSEVRGVLEFRQRIGDLKDRLEKLSSSERGRIGLD